MSQGFGISGGVEARKSLVDRNYDASPMIGGHPVEARKSLVDRNCAVAEKYTRQKVEARKSLVDRNNVYEKEIEPEHGRGSQEPRGSKYGQLYHFICHTLRRGSQEPRRSKSLNT